MNITRYTADFVPKGFITIDKSELVKKDDWFWTCNHYRPAHDFMIGHRTSLPVVRRKHDSTKTEIPIGTNSN